METRPRPAGTLVAEAFAVVFDFEDNGGGLKSQANGSAF